MVFLIFVAGSVPLYATDLTRTSAGKSFSKDWVAYAEGPGTKLRYAYNKYLLVLKEDQSQSTSNGLNSDTRYHRAKLINGSGTFYGPKKQNCIGTVYTISNVEKGHSGSTVTYVSQYNLA